MRHEDTDQADSQGRRTFLKAVGGSSVVGATTMLAGCGGDSEDTPTETDTGPGTGGTETTEPDDGGDETPSGERYGGDLVIGEFTQPGDYIFAAFNFQQDTTKLAQLWGDQLEHLNEGLELEPRLAAERSVSDDGLEYTYTIREGVTSHPPYDDHEVTASDVVTTFRHILDADNGARVYDPFVGVLVDGDSGQSPEDAVEAASEYEVQFNLAQAFPSLPFFISAPANVVVPDPSWEEHGLDMGTLPEPGPIGTGPFIFDEAEPDQYYKFRRNPNYWKEDDEGNQLPYLDSVENRVYIEDSSRWSAFQTGEVDWSPAIPSHRFEDMENNSDVVGRSVDSTRVLQNFLNWRHWEPASSQPFRQGIALAMNFDAINQTIFSGRGSTQISGADTYQPGHAEFEDSESIYREYERGPDARPDEAAAKFEEAGYSGLEFDIIAPTGAEILPQAATVMQQAFQDAGLNPSIRTMGGEASWGSWIGYWDDPENHPPPDQDMLLESLDHPIPSKFEYVIDRYGQNLVSNASYVDIEELNQKFEEIQNEPTPEGRDPLYREAEELICQQVPVPRSVWFPFTFGAQAYVQNPPWHPVRHPNLRDTWLDE